MYIDRKTHKRLKKWRREINRKPLIIRGARQVGKSTLVNEFGNEYVVYINLNLEKEIDRNFFEKYNTVQDILEAILLERNIRADLSEILLFIDEIQESTKAIQLLRYFYEELPQLSVIAAGSLLEFALEDQRPFPVGRVLQIPLGPLDFEEFLGAIGEDVALDYLQTIPLNPIAYQKLITLFHRYIIIGGMPEVVLNYKQNQQTLVGLNDIYSSIWDNYKSDIPKYATNKSQVAVLNHIILHAPGVRDRITYAGFGSSQYKSQKISDAFGVLDMARLIRIIHPTSDTILPMSPVSKRKPKVQFLDTGILNYANGMQSEMLTIQDFNSLYRGYFVNHMINQELIALSDNVGYKPMFWVRENANANAEVDIVIQYRKWIIPVEVKSGAKGRLRSLHEFIDRADHNYAVRFLANEMSIEESVTRNGKKFQLLNLPYFCATQIIKYLDWWIK
jgi:predicted AAA+ superfamily ATPase